jgi:hypothetical protein
LPALRFSLKEREIHDSGPTPAVAANAPSPASVAKQPEQRVEALLIIGGAIGGGVPGSREWSSP